MSFAPLAAGTPIEVRGMHPEGRVVKFAVPPPPRVEIEIEHRREEVQPRITNLVIKPADMKVSITYLAETRDLPRVFIPGIHRHIPLAAYINGGKAIRYETPPTVHDQLVAAGLVPS
jgi:hypothetical protein